SPISKIMERIIYVQLVKFIETNNILPDSQHGFRTSKSVTSQLLETFNDLTNSIENKEIVDVIYFDYRKAFDSISHKKLLDKLTNFGITGALHKWIASYLSNRKFKVKIQTSFSNTKSIISGVPQGSILGPLLFILYISDLPEKCKTKGVEIKLFADDLKAYYISKPSPSFSSTLQNFISNLEIYSAQNDLFLSTEKCKVLHIGRQNPKSQYSLYNSLISSIQKEESIRDLGVHFQSDLKWDSHINIIVSKAKKVMFTIIKSLKTNNPHILLNLYKIYIRPIIEFASPIFNPYLKKDIEHIETVQKTFLKMLGHSINDPQLIQNLPYNIIRSDRQSKKGGGVCVFLAKNISFLKIDIPKNKNFDLCAFDIFDSKTISKHRFILVYRPPSLTNFDENLELLDQLSILCSANFSTTIIGDLNLPKINWDTKSSTNINQTEKCFLELSNQLKLTQMITFPTRENNVLDILLTCTPHIITNIQSLPPFSQNDHISDHLSFKFQLCFSQEQQTSLTKLDYKNANYDNINTYLSYIDWNNVFSYSTEIDAQYQSFINILKTAIHLYTPIKKSKSLISKLPKHIQSMIINRDKLFSQYQNNQIIEKINQTSQKIDKEIQRYYRNRENSKMSKLETKYDFVANFLKNRKTNIPTLIDEENNPIFKDNEKAEQIAIFIEKTQTKQNSHYDITLKNPQQKINNIDISELNVFELLSNLSNKINESSDSIPEYFLKKCSATLAYPLYYLFTKSFISSELPEKWKEAIIVPIPKTLNSSSPNDYRPISLLSPISKIMERIIYVQLVKFIETNNILPDSQHGFRTSKSVTSQLLETFNDLTNSIENKEIVDVIYFDYRKAFDSISHKKLLDKLTNFGITGALHKWIASYLSNRKFKKFTQHKTTYFYPRKSVRYSTLGVRIRSHNTLFITH
uniref:Reverse transcriptase domain-containing protein n=1 Tax=Meloidogyne incognita TaxID=6306 RepID=A0A914NFB3_MELIC